MTCLATCYFHSFLCGSGWLLKVIESKLIRQWLGYRKSGQIVFLLTQGVNSRVIEIYPHNILDFFQNGMFGLFQKCMRILFFKERFVIWDYVGKHYCFKLSRIKIKIQLETLIEGHFRIGFLCCWIEKKKLSAITHAHV